MKDFFFRQSGESDAHWVLRLHNDPWFEDCTPKELAEFTGLPVKKVRRAVYSWAKSAKVKRIHQHASLVAEQVGWPGTPEGLIHVALERYVQRQRARSSR